MTAATPPRGWPAGVPPRLLGADQAAYYCGVSRNTFLNRVTIGAYPKGVKDGHLTHWDIRQLDAAIDKRFGVSSESANGEVDPLAAYR